MSDFVRFGDHISITKGKPPALIPFDGADAAAYLTPEYMRNRAAAVPAKPGRDAVVVADDDAVLLWDGSNAGEFFRGKAGLAASTMARLRPDESFDRRYLVHALKLLEPRLKSQTTGTGIPHVDREVLEALRMFRPDPREQQQVAHVLDALDTTIRKTEAIIDKLKQIKQGLLHDLLTRGIADNGELRPPQSEAPHLYKESALGWLPVPWRIDVLGACASVAGGVTLGRFVSGPNTIELPYLRVANVQDGFLDLTEVKTIRVLSREVARYSLEHGDVLMNEGGDFDKLGRGVVWGGQIAQCLHQNHVFRVRCVRKLLDPDYLASYSSSARGRQFFIQSSKQTTNLASINSTQLKGFPLRLPRLAEQGAIVEIIAGLDARVRAESASLGKSQILKSGLMDDLLTGRVRVTPLLQRAPA